MEGGGQGTTGRETSKSHRDLAGRGRGGRAALGSYRQSGGANSTRKTWGALVGETGRSQLKSTVTLGHSLGLRGHGRGSHGNIFKAAGKETHPKSWPRRHLLLASAPGRMALPSVEMRNSPPESNHLPKSARVRVTPGARVEAHHACYLTSMSPQVGAPWF